jgi:hypothetical protein
MVGSLEASPVLKLGGRRRRIKFLFLFSGNLIYHVEQGNIISRFFQQHWESEYFFRKKSILP